MYKVQKVSYGFRVSPELQDGSKIKFDNNNIVRSTRIDERNLKFCLYLNLRDASITSLDTTWLGALRVLILWDVKIDSINTKFLINVEYLDLGFTNISILDTSFLGALRNLNLYETPIDTLNTDSLVNLQVLDLSFSKI